MPNATIATVKSVVQRTTQKALRELRKPGWVIVATLTAAMVASAMITTSRSPAEATFAAENRAAMEIMMKRMRKSYSGNVDREFAESMIAHHQGAVDMALAELRHGRNEGLRRLAQGIVVEQQQEIVAMQTVLEQELTQSGEAVEEESICRTAITD